MPKAILFPGQGAQSVGMGKALAQRSLAASSLFSQASEILGYDLLQLCSEGPADELSRTEFSQPALFVHSYAAMQELENENPDLWNDVRCVAGLSLGEYTAVAAAGGLSFADGVRLVQARGRAMQAAADATPSGMSSILGLEADKLQHVCAEASNEGDFAQMANLLCPGNIAISGHLSALERAEKLATESGAMRAVRLQVAGAFHTSIMAPAVTELEKALALAEFSTTRVPVVSNVDAAEHSSPSDFQRLLPQQVISPVRWEDSLRAMIAMGVDSFIEVGAGRVLAGTLKRIDRKISCENYGD